MLFLLSRLESDVQALKARIHYQIPVSQLMRPAGQVTKRVLAARVYLPKPWWLHKSD